MDVGGIKDAVDEYSRSVDVLPLNGDTQIALGEALIIRGYPEQSKKHFDTAVDLVDNPSTRSIINLMSAPVTGNYAGADGVLHDRNVGVPALLSKAASDAIVAIQSGNAEAKASAAAELASLPREMTGRLSSTMLGALGDNADALKQVEVSANRGNVDAASFLFIPSMAGALRDPSFPSLAQRLGLMRYWKTTHTKPDVCSAKDPPPFCRMI
jgi:hypothetical protein